MMKVKNLISELLEFPMDIEITDNINMKDGDGIK